MVVVVVEDENVAAQGMAMLISYDSISFRLAHSAVHKIYKFIKIISHTPYECRNAALMLFREIAII